MFRKKLYLALFAFLIAASPVAVMAEGEAAASSVASAEESSTEDDDLISVGNELAPLEEERLQGNILGINVQSAILAIEYDDLGNLKTPEETIRKIRQDYERLTDAQKLYAGSLEGLVKAETALGITYTPSEEDEAQETKYDVQTNEGVDMTVTISYEGEEPDVTIKGTDGAEVSLAGLTTFGMGDASITVTRETGKIRLDMEHPENGWWQLRAQGDDVKYSMSEAQEAGDESAASEDGADEISEVSTITEAPEDTGQETTIMPETETEKGGSLILSLLPAIIIGIAGVGAVVLLRLYAGKLKKKESGEAEGLKSKEDKKAKTKKNEKPEEKGSMIKEEPLSEEEEVDSLLGTFGKMKKDYLSEDDDRPAEGSKEKDESAKETKDREVRSMIIEKDEYPSQMLGTPVNVKDDFVGGGSSKDAAAEAVSSQDDFESDLDFLFE